MALLDEFLIRWVSDTGALDRDLDTSGKKSDELNKKLTDTEGVAKRVGQNLATLASGALAGIAAAIGASSLVQNAIARAEDIVAIDQTAQALGVAVGEVDAFGKAMENMGLDAQGARDSLTDMGESIGEAMQDIESGRAKTFTALGISLKDVNGQAINAQEGIFRLADAVQGLDRSAAVFRIKELGITDNRMVEAILRGRSELERMIGIQKEQGVITREQVEQARRYTETMNQFRASTRSVSDGIAQALIPALTTIVEWLTVIVRWVGENRNFIIGFFAAVAGIVTALYLPAMIAAAAATIAATWPILAMIAAVVAIAAAFALAYDDIMAFVQGNDSFIGQIFEKFPAVEAAVFAVIDAFRFMGTVVAGVWEGIIASVRFAVNFVTAAISQIVEGIGKAGEIGMKIAAFFGLGGGEGVAAANTQLASAENSPLNSVTSNAISNSSNVRESTVAIGQITVESQATDAKGVAADIGSELGSQMADLNSEFSSGVER